MCEASGISYAYAYLIDNGDRIPPRPLAICLFRKTGWRHPVIEAMTEDQMRVYEEVEPWVAPSERAA